MDEVERILEFLRHTFQKCGCSSAVIAVSGGIDSAVSLSLVTQALGSESVYPLLLPYGDQNMDDARTICDWNQIPASNVNSIDIKPMVEVTARSLDIPSNEPLRLGNVMARVRMISVFDRAKELQGLVVGTENKSEHHLGYFTRFGDGASDIEPIVHLYKTQVRELALELDIPKVFLDKAPSAGLWQDQTDEQEMGFSYDDADRVLEQLIDLGIPQSEITIDGMGAEVIDIVCQHVKNQAFKLEVPYLIKERT